MRFTPDNITELAPNEVIVGGTNEQGIHGGGIAKLMYKKWGAKWGQGEGRMGQCIGIPTKSTPWITLPIEKIKLYVDRFVDYAKDNPETFLVTKIGCGLAGYAVKDIAPLFIQTAGMDNVVLPKSFHDVNRNLADAMPTAYKGPMGVMPSFMWKEQRVEALLAAIGRFEQAGQYVPPEWHEELKGHLAEAHDKYIKFKEQWRKAGL